MSDAIAIRAARPGDGEAIARMHLENAAYYRALAPASFRMPDEEGLAESVEPPADPDPATLELVAEIGDEAVGYLSAHLIAPDDSARFQMVPYLAAPRLWIDSLGTLRRHWRRGVGGLLVEAAESWGREHGAVVAMCDTWVGSPVSLPFWEGRMGYGRRAVILEKPL